MKQHVHLNGFTTLAARRASLPIVSMQLRVESGAYHEQEYRGYGLAHLVEHMVFAGSDEVEPGTYRHEVAQLGGTCMAQTRYSHTRFNILGPSVNARQLLHLLMQLVFHPTFPESAWKKEQGVIEQEMDMMENSEGELIYSTLWKTLRGKRRMYLHPVGERERFRTLNLSHIRRFHRTWYIPRNCFLCVAGDIDEKELYSWIDEELAELPNPPLPYVDYPLETPAEWPTPQRFQRTCRISSLILAWRVPVLRGIPAFASEVLCAILNEHQELLLAAGEDGEKIIPENLRCRVFQETAGDRVMLLSASVPLDRRQKLRDILLHSLARLDARKLSLILPGIRNRMKLAMQRQLSSVQGITELYSQQWHMERRTDIAESWEAMMAHLSADDLFRLSQELFLPMYTYEASIDPETQKPAAHSAPESSQEETREWAMPNGLRVAVRFSPSATLLSISLSVATGARSETPEMAGVNELVARCLRRLAYRSDFPALKDLREKGGCISCHSGNDCLHVTGTAQPDHSNLLLASLFHLISIPSGFAEVVETEKSGMRLALLRGKTNLVESAFRQLRRCCYGGQSYGLPRLGSTESLQQLSPVVVTEFAKRQCCAGNIVLSIAGGIPFEQMEETVAPYASTLPQGCPVKPAVTPAQRSISEKIDFPGSQSAVAMALAAASACSEDLACMMIFSDWCRATSGPVFQALRIRRGLSYQILCSEIVGADTGCHMFFVATLAEQCGAVRTALEDLFAEIYQNGIEESELESVRTRLCTNKAFQQQYGDKTCEAMSKSLILQHSAQADLRLMEEIRRVSVAAMNSYLRRILAPGNARTWVTVQATSSRGEP